MRIIFLTGPKYSGKTSAGKALAAFCGCIFTDLDSVILQKTGKSSGQLFSENPEILKKAEVDALSDIMSSKGVEREWRVVATGGGIIDNPEAAAILANAGSTVIYLSISADTAWQRICTAGELPPFLQSENPQEIHRTLHERQAAAYAKLANITISTEGKTPEETAKEIYVTLITRDT
jgi:shikimate kinase